MTFTMLSHRHLYQFKPYTMMVAAVLCVLLTGCDNAQHKTDSQRFREDAIKQAQIPIHKAQQLFTPQVEQSPEDNLDDLVIISGLILDAQQSYAKSQITNHNDTSLLELDTKLTNMEPELVVLAKDLLHQTVTLTEQLRKQIEDAKNRPYSAKDQDTSGLVNFLGDGFNVKVKSCCLGKLSNIEKILVRNVKQHRELIKLVRSINDELGKVIQDKQYGHNLHKRIDEL